MNIHQSRGVTRLLEEAARITGSVEEDMHLGAGHKIIRAEVDDDDDTLDGYVRVVIWRGGRGTSVMLDTDGDPVDAEDWEYDFKYTPVRLTVREDGSFSTTASVPGVPA